jgi:hypothetical protein
VCIQTRSRKRFEEKEEIWIEKTALDWSLIAIYPINLPASQPHMGPSSPQLPFPRTKNLATAYNPALAGRILDPPRAAGGR